MERQKILKPNHIYAVDGGIFRAKYLEEEDRFELWRLPGARDIVVNRTGFYIDVHGRLSHRIYDIEVEDHVLFSSDITVSDLEEVDSTTMLPVGSREEIREAVEPNDEPESPW